MEREKVENFLKKMSLNTWRTVFKKLSIRFLIDWKLGSIDQKCFNWSSINRASIETDKGWPKFLIAILIDRKIGSIDRNSGKNKFLQKILKALNLMNKMHEYEMKCFSKTQVLNLVFPTLRFSIHSLKFSSIKYVLHKTQGIFKLGWSNQKHTI